MRALLFAAMLLLLPRVVAAQAAEPDAVSSVVTEVEAALEAGDLITAGTALDRGLSLSVLSPEALGRLYVLRASLAYADDRLGLLEESLRALAMLRVPMPTSFPRALRARYEEVLALEPRLALSIELVTEVGAERSVRVVPTADGDAGHLVRALEVMASIDEGPLVPVSPEMLLDAGDPHASVDVRYVITALGPGGAILATRGTTEAPAVETLEALPVDQTFLHVTLATLAAVVVVGAFSVGMAYLATDGFTAGQSSTLGPVTCTGPPCMSF